MGGAGQEKETGGQNQKRFVYDRFSFNLQCMLFVVCLGCQVSCVICMGSLRNLFVFLVSSFVGLLVCLFEKKHFPRIARTPRNLLFGKS